MASKQVPLRFQARCRRRLNLALVSVCVDFMLYAFLVKDACLFFVVFDLVFFCRVIVVSPVVGASVLI